MSLFGNAKIVRKLRRILGWVGGGVYKRIDENREVVELLHREAPDLVAKHPEIIGWLQSHDDFLCKLEATLPPDDVQFRPRQQMEGNGNPGFPRPWVIDDAESLRRQTTFSTQGKTEREQGPVPFRAAGRLDPNWSWWLVWNTNPPDSKNGDGLHAWEWEEVLPGNELEAKLRAMGLSEAIPGWGSLMDTDRTYINGRWMKIAACKRITGDDIEINVGDSQRNAGRATSAAIQINISGSQHNAGRGFQGDKIGC